MLRWLRVGFWFALASVTSCARSALPIGPGASDEVAGAPAVRPPQPTDAEEEACPPCVEGLSAAQSLHCLCRTSKCPRDLKAAFSNIDSYLAYGTGCGQAWFVQLAPYGFDLIGYGRDSGDLESVQQIASNEAITCEDGTPLLLVEGGIALECAHLDYCRFAHVDFAVAIGGWDSLMTCDERMFR